MPILHLHDNRFDDPVTPPMRGPTNCGRLVLELDYGDWGREFDAHLAQLFAERADVVAIERIDDGQWFVRGPVRFERCGIPLPRQATTPTPTQRYQRLLDEAEVEWNAMSAKEQEQFTGRTKTRSNVSIAVHGPGGGGGRAIPVRHVDANGNVLHVGVGTIEESYETIGKEES